jgi:hypothetical protein
MSNPAEYLKSHIDQITSIVLLTSKIDLTLPEPDAELDLKQKRQTSNIRLNLHKCLTLVREMQLIH